MSKERPILFSGPIVRAILAGRKTQTRRVMNGVGSWPYVRGVNGGASWATPDGHPYPERGFVKCPHGTIGDRLWVREAFCQKFEDSGFVYNHEGNLDSTCCLYKADGVHVVCVDGDGFTKFNKDGTESSPWTPSIHMPRWASRITLEITGVRVERLQDITHRDAIAEGIPKGNWSDGDRDPCVMMDDPRDDFMELWQSINGPESWSANPWVWVIDFKRLETSNP